MLQSKALVVSVASLCLAAGSAAFAAHPLQTEDTGTQGFGNVEIENGLSWTRSGSTSTLLYQPQISVGASHALDLIVQPSWLRSRFAGESRVQGLGDTNLDAKWRFFSDARGSLAIRAGLGLATGNAGLGAPNGQTGTHVVLAATFDAAPFVTHGNVGFTHIPGDGSQKEDRGHVSAALMWACSQSLVLTTGASIDSSATPGSRSLQGSGLVGVIYSLRRGLDLDLGYQATVRAMPNARVWLLGMTYRFAP